MRCLVGAIVVWLVGFSNLAIPADPLKVKVVLAGDSTVADGSGWGPALGPLFGPNVEVINLARSGASSKSYRIIGQWKNVLAAKPDWVLIQFGHNDQPGKGPDRETDSKTTFRENLARFADEAATAGAKVVLVTPLARRIFDANGKVRTDLGPYAEAVRAVAKEKKLPVVDLYARSVEHLEAIGPEKAVVYNPPAKEPGMVDRTHLSAAGAAATAKLVVAELRASAPDLSKLLKR